MYNECVTDTQICGAKFCDGDGYAFGVTGYDLSEIIRYTQAQGVAARTGTSYSDVDTGGTLLREYCGPVRPEECLIAVGGQVGRRPET